MVSDISVSQKTSRELRLREGIGLRRKRLPLSQRKFRAGTTGFMFLMHVAAVFALLPRFWSLPAVLAFSFLYWVTVLGVTLGLHRLLAHRSFDTPVWVERIFVFMGSLACQSGPIEWVALHRHHHKFSDQPNDHHDAGRGFWWSHSEWMLHEIPALRISDKFVGDLVQDPFYCWLDHWFLLLQIPLGLALYWVGNLTQVHGGGLGLFLWGVPLRLVVVYHVTWLVNSATHKFGYRNFDSPDLSTNCWWVAIFSFGEGWHNNHHAYPMSARHGLRWFEFDFTWQHIKLLRNLGLARQVRQAKYLP
ncbi:acyl-CoA desaturase [Prochlorococcus sp. MIT 1341]|uniref:acyl-CoA desaturase n=1 Tax=Prochlorococcus sp. MIT 1341 TaxID=3096221 RepID=UPI002A75E096|nr:fatty acid desaturase [Prochlorococcus sp. MIT 1341]